MNRKILFIIFIVLTTIVIGIIEYGIRTYDMRFYAGKDNGLAKQFESICILSTIYFIIMSKQKRLLYGLFGLLVGIITGVVCYFVLSSLGVFGLLFHIISCLIFIIIFHGIEKLKKTIPHWLKRII